MKIKYTLEYPLNSSPKVLYNRLSTPGGISEWFADDVTIKGDEFNFIWDGSENKALLVAKKDQKYVRFKWNDEEQEDAYFEFRISIDELTGDLSLIITDFADDDEIEDAKNLWDSQIQELKRILGT